MSTESNPEPSADSSADSSSATSGVRVLIVDDHDVFTECLSITLRMEGLEPVVPPSLDEAVVIELAREASPDVVLLDLDLGGGRTAIPLVAPLAALGARVMVLTGSPDEGLQGAALTEGAYGVFVKHGSLEDLCRTIASLTEGQAVLRPAARDQLIAQAAQRADAVAKVERLSHREREVLDALVDGQPAEAIAQQQFVALGTVRSHIRAILRKLEVSSQLAAVAVVRRAGYPPR